MKKLNTSEEFSAGNCVLSDGSSVICFSSDPTDSQSAEILSVFSVPGQTREDIVNFWQSSRPDLFLGVVASSCESIVTTMTSGLSEEGRLSSVGLDPLSSIVSRSVSAYFDQTPIQLSLGDGSMNLLRWTVAFDEMRGALGTTAFHGTSRACAESIRETGFRQNIKQYAATPDDLVFFTNAPQLAVVHAFNAVNNSCDRDDLVVIKVTIPSEMVRRVDYDAENGWINNNCVPVNDSKTVIRETGLFAVPLPLSNSVVAEMRLASSVFAVRGDDTPYFDFWPLLD